MITNNKVILICPQPYMINRGTPLAIKNIASAIVEVGYSVDLVTTHLGKAEVIDGVRVCRIMNVPFIKQLKPGLSKEKLLLMPLIFIKALSLMMINDYDFIVSLEDGALHASILRLLFNKKHVYRMHSLPTEHSSKLKLYEKIVFNNADVLLPILPTEIKTINERLGNNNKKIIVMEVLPAMKNDVVNVDRVIQLKNIFGIKNDDVVVLWIGNMAPYQGSSLLFKAIKKIDNDKIKFLVMTNEDIINKGSNLITYNPELDDMPNIVAIGDIVLSLRHIEHGFPSKVKVFLRAGKAIIAINNNVHKVHLTHKKNSYLINYDNNELISAINTLANDKSERERIGNNAREYYDKNFSWKKYVNCWRRALENE